MRVARTSTALRAVAHRSRLQSDNAKRRQPCVFCTQQPFARSTDDTGNRRQLLRRDDGQYAGPPFAGPAAVLAYLSRYTHRVAIANSRLIAFDEHHVTFRWKDYRAKSENRYKTMSLATDEFIRRFLIHVLPRGFHRIRHYGLFANGQRAENLVKTRKLLGVKTPQDSDDDDTAAPDWLLCPACGATMRIIEIFEPGHTPRSPPHRGRDPP